MKDNTLEFEDVNYVEVEYLELPITDTNRTFLYRFSKPFKTVMTLDTVKIGLLEDFQLGTTLLEERLLDKFKTIIGNFSNIEQTVHKMEKTLKGEYNKESFDKASEKEKINFKNKYVNLKEALEFRKRLASIDRVSLIPLKIVRE